MLGSMENSDISESAFSTLAKFVYDESGLLLVPEKSVMIQSRIRPRMKSLNIKKFDEYVEFVCSSDGDVEQRYLISALTTNVSHFFREEHHFDLMIDHIRTKLSKRSSNEDRLRVWSAGCSNGQEACSITISILERIPEARNMDLKILATDIDPKVVKFARDGCYPQNMVSNLSEEILDKYFTKSEDANYSANDELKSRITFRELNLLKNWPMKNGFDVIFCRNVVIYFDQETQRQLWPRFREKLPANGRLFLGHSERMVSAESFGFHTCGPTAYAAELMTAGQDNSEIKESHNGIA
ncbi:MAG: protein-glutamate O-methyltransferase CheR [Paracoccaceae bacterium]